MQVPVELKRRYLERRIQDIEHLISSLEVNDFAPALKLGHQVKGNAETFDFPQLAPLGIQIENAAKKQDKEGVQNLIHLMASEINLARQTFH
ncbi:MAG: Hpt domain-containing protein [Bdellovibrionales bacterium]|nr:Hpt domain-containing protein [Bdellovibrionales bacterium]